MSKEQRIEQAAEWLEDLDEEQLRKILRSELQAEPMDVALIKRVNAVLATKSKESGSDETEAAWQRFLSDHADCEPIYEVDLPGNDAKKRDRRASTWKKPVMRTAAAAVIALALLGSTTLTARAAGFDLWGAVATWVSETFGFGQGDIRDRKEIPQQLGELRTLMENHNVDGDLLPTYIPAGYEAVSTKCMDDSDYCVTYGCELCNAKDEHIILQYREYKDRKDMNAFQKSNPDVEVYTVGGKEHYITDNAEFYTAAWVNGNVEVHLSVPNSRKELTKIIDSIYGE